MNYLMESIGMGGVLSISYPRKVDMNETKSTPLGRDLDKNTVIV